MRIQAHRFCSRKRLRVSECTRCIRRAIFAIGPTRENEPVSIRLFLRHLKQARENRLLIASAFAGFRRQRYRRLATGQQTDRWSDRQTIANDAANNARKCDGDLTRLALYE